MQRSDADLASMKAQLVEAERGASESEQLAVQSRKDAERLAELAAKTEDTTEEYTLLTALRE